MTSPEDRYRTLLDASSALADQPTVKAVLHSLRGVLSSSSKLHGIDLYVLSDDGDTLDCLAFDREVDAPAIKAGTKMLRVGLVARVLEEQKPVFIPELSQAMLEQPGLAPFAAESIGRSTYVFPVSTHHQRYGILAVTKDRGQEFIPEDVDMLRAMVAHVAVALECAIARETTDHYQREAEKERDRLRLVLDMTPALIHTARPDGYIDFFNQTWLSYVGLPLAQIQGWKWTIAIHPEDLEGIVKKWRSCLETGEPFRYEARVRRGDGKYRWMLHHKTPARDRDGNIVKWYGSSIDIEDRKRAEIALRQSETYLAEAQRLTHTGSWALNAASREYTYWSDEMFRIFGVDPHGGTPTREAMARRIHPEDVSRAMAGFEKCLREKVDTSDEYRFVLPDGTVKHIQSVRHPALNVAGDVIQLVGTFVDITPRKRAEEALRTSKAQLAHERDRLALLLEINNHIVSKLDVNEFLQAVAASMRKHLGSDATTLWLVNKQAGCLERKYFDFPTGKGFLEKVVVTVPTKLESEWWRLRRPQFYTPEMKGLPPVLRDALKAESLVSRVSVPLVGANGPLGLMNMSSREANAFSAADLDLLSQIGTQISLALDNALAYGRLRASHDNLAHQRLYLESEISSEYCFEDIVGKSSAFKRVLEQVSVVAATDSTVLLHGETGTGKELIARAIHNLSSRRNRVFVRMNCAAIPSGLLESELFGHEKGAFTGALMQRRGRFELADTGSLFLDEIGDISLELQPKLLRAVQEQEFERLGSAKTIHVDVRLIAATHRNLRTMIRESKFREDLFYRLNVFPIEIPPLRERRDDIPLLVNYFVSKSSRRMGKNIKSIPGETMEVFMNHPWPGNIRELANFIERAVILTQGDELEVPLAELSASSVLEASTAMRLTVQEAERAMITDALRAASGRISGKRGAAERLGLKRTTLQNKIRRLGIALNGRGDGSSAA